jgi:putative ABC transport system permease protein
MSWTLAGRNLWRSKRRTAVTALAVALGVAGLSLAAGYVFRVKNYMTVWSIYHNYTGHVSVYKKGGLESAAVRPRTFTLTPSDLALLQKLSNEISSGGNRVERVVPFLLGTGLAGNGCKTMPFSARGMPVDFERWMRSHPAVLQWTPELAAVKLGVGLGRSPSLNGVVVGQGLLALLTKDPSLFSGAKTSSFVPDCSLPADVEKLRFDANIQLASTGFEGEFGVVDAELVGSFSSGYADVDASILSAPLNLLRQLYGTENATSAAIYLSNATEAPSFARELSERAKAAGAEWDTYVYDDVDVAPVLVGTLTFLYTLGAAIAVVLCGLASLTILNTMTITVSERTREMGMLRSLGFRKKDLTRLFVKEAVLCLAGGALLGMAIASLAASIINAMNFRFKPPGIADTMQFLIVLSPSVLFAIALVLGALGALATLVAVRGKVNEPVAKLLSSTGA